AALLISGLKEKGVKYSPYSIKRAISETATKLDYVDQFAQGNGLLNVEKAFDHLVKYANEQENMIRFRVDCGKGKKGIHIRSGQLKKPHDYTVQIEPLFFNQDKTVFIFRLFARFNLNIGIIRISLNIKRINFFNSYASDIYCKPLLNCKKFMGFLLVGEKPLELD
uniref:Tripeptidyl-peptidase II first Ig-like domain-containing protein n=1 Tax=Megaselia scalaris TaxID=36166 RepID=T1GG06_MEGSC